MTRGSDNGRGKGGDTPKSASTRPYLIRAIFDWCLDSDLTPQIMVNAEMPDVVVPLNYARDGKIVLNLHPSSVRGLELGNEFLMFSARFSGRAEEIIVPVVAVMAVYARENGKGIVFQADGSSMTPPEPGESKPRTSGDDAAADSKSGDSLADSKAGTTPVKRPGGHLKIVK